MLFVVKKANDFLTDNIIHYLYELGVSDILCVEAKGSLTVENIDIKKNKCILTVDGRYLDVDEVTLFWYRGGLLPMPKFSKTVENPDINNQVSSHLKHEWKILQNFIFNRLQESIHIGDFFIAEMNKIDNLRVAHSIGLLIPNTYIGQSSFFKNFELSDDIRYITKPIGESIPLVVDNDIYRLYTQEVLISLLKNSTDIYFPSLLQNKVDVEYEVRTFVFYEWQEFYSMAIFSTSREASVDSRESICSNRYAPYNLPKEIKKKLLRFMREVGIDTASFDLLKNNKGYVFIEANPFGNIEMLNEICGYDIDRRFAQFIYSKYSAVL